MGPLLQEGVPLEHISKLPGHRSVTTSERHYAKWVNRRQDQLDILLEDEESHLELCRRHNLEALVGHLVLYGVGFGGLPDNPGTCFRSVADVDSIGGFCLRWGGGMSTLARIIFRYEGNPNPEEMVRDLDSLDSRLKPEAVIRETGTLGR
jgi:hypothetical protein